MLSVAEVPMGPVHFTGVIGIIQLSGREYRFATYLGAKVVKIRDGQVIVRQGALTLTATLLEKPACHARYLLSDNRKTIIEFETAAASFKYEYP